MIVAKYAIDEEVKATSHINFLAGAFNLGNTWRIPYFVSTMTLKDAASDLNLATDIPGADTVDWTVQELYQRDIDWARVEGPLLSYLRKPNDPQFFNSITVALLPLNPETRRIEPNFESGFDWSAPTLNSALEMGKSLDIGPIRVGFYEDWTDFDDEKFVMGKMRWNLEQVHGVAIDGQHRLAAIKELIAKEPNAKSRVPVIFLIFDERLGFKSDHLTEMTPLLRRLFIDLNKHAKTVSRARQILLDDRDPHSRCVRGFIADKLAGDLDQMAPESEPRLPLSLVDWHSEQAKFSEGPYITTVLGMDWIVALVLGDKPVKDFTNYDKVKSQLEVLSSRLHVDLATALERLADDELAQIPFAYGDPELEAIEAGFRAVWNRPLLTILTEFAPYRAFLKKRSNDGTLALQWQMWFKLKEASQKGGVHAEQELSAFQQQLKFDEPPSNYKTFVKQLVALNEMKADDLAFNVAFQRAYVLAFMEFAKFKDADLADFEQWANDGVVDLEDLQDDVDLEAGEHLDGDAESGDLEDSTPLQDEERLANLFVASLNRFLHVFPDFTLLEASIQTSSGDSAALWGGSLRSADAGIDFTQGASQRAKDFVFLVAALTLLQQEAKDADLNFEDIWAELTDSSYYGAFKKMGRAARRMWTGERSIAGRLLGAAETDYSEVEAQALIRDRLAAVWELVRQ